MWSHVDELMYRAHAPQNSPVTDRHVTRYLRVIAHDAIIAYGTIMRKMAICHEETIFSDYCLVFHFCSPIHRYKFADRGIIPDENGRIFALVFHILGNRSDDGSGKNAAIFPDTCAFHDRYIRADPCSFTNLHILMNNSKWIHLYIRCQPGIWMNISMRMNHEGRYKKVTLKT